MPKRGRKRPLSSQVAGLAAAASLPATVATIMFATGRWDLPALAMILILSLPLYVLGRDGARASHVIE
jgi:hypothetical protein